MSHEQPAADDGLELVEVLVAHKYPWNGADRAVGEKYRLPPTDAESLLGMGFVRRCPHPDNSLPGEGDHVAPTRAPHPDHGLPGTGAGAHPDHDLPPRARPKK